MGAGKGPLIDGHWKVCRLKNGSKLTAESADYGKRMDYLCSTLKVCGKYWLSGVEEFWGYAMHPRLYPKMHRMQEERKKPVRFEIEAVELWLSRYRDMADVRVDHTDAKSRMAKEGDEPWFSTGMGAIVIAAASGMFSRIVLGGFDAVLSGDRKNFKKHPGVQRFDKFANHAWNVEHAMLPMIQSEYQVEITPL